MWAKNIAKTVNMEDIFEKLCKKFKISNLKEYQKNVLKHLSQREDCFVLQPTGSGKSILFQAWPFLHQFILEKEGDISKKSFCVIVVSPIVSLIDDQMKGLKELGINAISLAGTNSNAELQVNIWLYIYI